MNTIQKLFVNGKQSKIGKATLEDDVSNALLPPATAEDEGRVVSVTETGEYGLSTIESGLPQATSEDVGKIVSVGEDGSYELVPFQEPTGTIEITENGIVDVADYASANVQVPNPSSGSITITENGTYDVTEKASANVNVTTKFPTVKVINETGSETLQLFFVYAVGSFSGGGAFNTTKKVALFYDGFSEYYDTFFSIGGVSHYVKYEVVIRNATQSFVIYAREDERILVQVRIKKTEVENIEIVLQRVAS